MVQLPYGYIARPPQSTTKIALSEPDTVGTGLTPPLHALRGTKDGILH